MSEPSASSDDEPIVVSFEVADHTPPPPHGRIAGLLTHPWWVLTGLAVLTGVLGGVIWHAMVALPSYTITDDYGAVLREYGLTQFFAADTWFAVLGLVFGIGLGVAAWQLLRQLGWPVALVAVGAGLLAALVCWQVGVAFGPSDFASRVTTAAPGDRVMIDFALHTWVPVLTWPFGAITPVLLYASLGRDLEEEPVSTDEGDQPDE